MKLDLDLIVWDMISMNVTKVEQIMQYGFTKEEAEEIKSEIMKK